MSAGCFVCRRDMPSRHRSAPVLPRECWQAQPAAACAHRPPSRAEPRAAHPAPRSNRPGTHSENELSLPSSPGLHYRLRRIGSRPPSHAGRTRSSSRRPNFGVFSNSARFAPCREALASGSRAQAPKSPHRPPRANQAERALPCSELRALEAPAQTRGLRRTVASSRSSG